MTEILPYIKGIFYSTGEYVTLFLEITSIGCIITGIVASFRLFLKLNKVTTALLYINVRTKFGGWLTLALDYQLASDIVATTIAPTYEHIIRVGAIALIRTFLNYFLNKDIRELAEARKILIENETANEKS
jgi:uncharacterized membrane protein